MKVTTGVVVAIYTITLVYLTKIADSRTLTSIPHIGDYEEMELEAEGMDNYGPHAITAYRPHAMSGAYPLLMLGKRGVSNERLRRGALSIGEHMARLRRGAITFGDDMARLRRAGKWSMAEGMARL